MDFTKALSVTAAGVLVSRLFGFLRDAAIAWALGVSPLADAFLAAIRLPDIVRRLLGEGTLSLTLTAKCRVCGGSPVRLAIDVGKIAVTATAVTVLLCIIAAPMLAACMAPGLPTDGTAFYLRLTLPYIVLAMITACAMAALHATGRFLIPAASPSLFNVCVLGAAVFAWYGHASDDRTALILAIGFLLGGLMPALIHLAALWPLYRPEQAPTPPDRTRAVAAALPGGLLSSAAPQLTLALACISASTLTEGHVSALFYAERLVEFPLGLTAAAIGMAAAPALAERQDAALLERRLSSAMTLTLCLSLPAVAGLAAIGAPLIRLLFMHGCFSAQAADLTTDFLYALLPGIPAYALIRPLLTVCQAQRSEWLSLGALASIATGIGMGFVFIAAFDLPVGPAFGAVFGLFVQMVLLLLIASRKATVSIAWGQVGLCASASLAVYGVAAVIAIACDAFLNDMAALVLAVPAGAAVFLLLIWPAVGNLRRQAEALSAGTPERP